MIEAHEERALRDQTLQDGCLALLDRCRAEGLRIGVITGTDSAWNTGPLT